MRTSLTALLFCGPILAAAASAPDTSKAEEVARITAIINLPDVAARTPGYRALDFSGITDPKLFDDLQDRIERGYLKARHDSNLVNEQRYLVQALATSGNPKYHKTLQKVIDGGRHVDERIRVWAEKALGELLQYADWNPIINEPRHGIPWSRAHLENAIDFDDLDMNKAVFKRIRERPESVDPAVYDRVDARIFALFNKKIDDPMTDEVTAWGCHTLAVSGNLKYEHTLKLLADDGNSRKVRGNCDDAVDELKEKAEKGSGR